jgi:hypothetical protein
MWKRLIYIAGRAAIREGRVGIDTGVGLAGADGDGVEECAAAVAFEVVGPWDGGLGGAGAGVWGSYFCGGCGDLGGLVVMG